MNVFLDTNILMDVLLQRKPFVTRAQRIWYLSERNKIHGMVSALSFANIYYMIRKAQGSRFAHSAMGMLRDTFTVVACTEQIINRAIDARLKDFEDALQFYSALHADAEYLITRNPDHFPPSDLSILSPQEFLAAHSFA